MGTFRDTEVDVVQLQSSKPNFNTTSNHGSFRQRTPKAFHHQGLQGFSCCHQSLPVVWTRPCQVARTILRQRLPRASSPSWDARLSSWDSPRPTESEVAQPEKVLMPSTLVRASTLLDLLMTQIPSLSSRSRRSRTEDLLCSPCSDSTFRLLSLERVQLPTGRLTLLTHGPSTVSPRSSPPSSPLEELF